MGDIVALVEKARETFEAEQAERMARRFAKGLFNMNDLKGQLEQMMKMGGMQGLMGMMPGMGGMAKKAEAAGFNDRMLTHQIALINSMTKKERANPDLLAASRKKRIAAGAGLDVAEVNKLIKQHRQMADMMKRMGKGGMMKQAIKQMLGGKGMPDLASMSPEAMEAAAKGMKEGMGLGGGFPGMPKGLSLPAGLSGLMKKK
jgi:signal recognition particle subunit SRP54